ncbi:MAG: hypothetical protein LBB53_04215 [Prevotellaceae bacterium]|jgi:C-terminal processing protease CtpA/Prc|nr:hypothetical protein [Prevotellaceae bacterium]
MSDIVSLFFAGERTFINNVYKTGTEHNDFSEKIPLIIKGKNFVSENVPVILLTGPQSYSAANIFAYIMKDLPNCTVAGKKTGGGGGRVRSMLLPNSWILYYPYMKTFSAQGENMEFPLMPDFYVKKTDKNMRDATNEGDIIIRAVKILDSINGF